LPKLTTLSSRRGSTRHYFLPVAGTKDEKVRRKSKVNGIFTIKWKKGKKQLNIDEED